LPAVKPAAGGQAACRPAGGAAECRRDGR